jgi:hypothetical protein
MRPKHLFHAIAGAERHIALKKQPAESAAENVPKDRIPVVRGHDRKPVREQPNQGNTNPSRGSSGHVAEPCLGECEDDIRFERIGGLLEAVVHPQGPVVILVIMQPFP